MSPHQHPDRHVPAPTLAELQRRVDAWIGQFEEGYWPPLSMLARLTEEVGELAREINHLYGHKPKKQDEAPGEIALEVADIIFVLVCLCNSLDIDLGDAFERVMQKYDARDRGRWTRRPGEAPSSGSARRATQPSGAPRPRSRERATSPSTRKRAVAPRPRRAVPGSPARRGKRRRTP